MVSKFQKARDFIGKELESIGTKQSGKQHGRLLIAKNDEDRFLASYRRIQEYMGRMLLQTTLSTTLSVSKIEAEQAKVCVPESHGPGSDIPPPQHHLSTDRRINRVEQEQLKDRMSSWVSRLPSSPSAWYKSSAAVELKRRECTPGTRVDVLANLLGWAANNSMDAVYWLNGMAGTGKTTIACSICQELAYKGELAASFFCSRLRQECRDVNLIIPSIAYQIARFSPPFQAALSAVIEQDK
ncbi:unnamed protein product, partial [Rhizoctonia solani]